MDVKDFWTGFFDGFTLKGLFGRLRLPSAPTTTFKEEPTSDEEVTDASRKQAAPHSCSSDRPA